MAATVPLKCRCGEVTGHAVDVSPATGNHITCMCDDCQAYAHHLGNAETLDANGGTEIFQLTPSQVKIECGREHLRCVRLTGGGLMRWYTGCCRTPVLNCMASPKMPFAGVPCVFMDDGGDPESLERAMGPLIAKVQGKFAKGIPPADASVRAPPSYLLRSVRLMFRAWRAGEHTPSPVFDADTGKPIVEPIVLSAKERDAIRPLCGPG